VGLDASADTVGIGGVISGGSLALGAAAHAFGGVLDLAPVRRGYSDAVSLAVNVTLGASLDASSGGTLRNTRGGSCGSSVGDGSKGQNSNLREEHLGGCCIKRIRI